MKQVLQNLGNGQTEVADVPCPAVKPGTLLIRTHRTVVSAGTERMLVDFGKAGLVGKARQQPDKVKQVLEKARTDGFIPTLEAVRNKLDQPLALGYCNVGTVLEVGVGVSEFAVGDRVVSNGKHAEVVCVPKNLCAKVPDGVPDDEAAFAVVSAIALQGVRLVQPTLGEAVAVVGTGLIGLLTVQLLRAHGCRVLGIDLDPERLAIARELGAEVVAVSAGEDPVAAAQAFSRGRGMDAVILTVASRSSEPVHQAAVMCRKRGRIVLVGVTGLELSRADFFEKELTFQVSCSYGPGRYDSSYEVRGNDYPVGFVRWTEQRNFEAVLDMIAEERLRLKPLISHRFGIGQAEQAYDLVSGTEPSLGILLDYPVPEEQSDDALRRRTLSVGPASRSKASRASVAFIGSGSYATSVLIPGFKETGARLKTVASSGGASGLHAARKFGFEETTTATDDVFADDEITTVVIATQHDSHAPLVCQALAAGKHVFVEKPLAIDTRGLADIEAAYAAAAERGAAPLVMVGFNRRFAPQIQKMNSLLSGVGEPKCFVMTVNAGAIPPDHWTQDAQVGGGRIVGEACHFIDLLRLLVGASITEARAVAMGRAPGVPVTDDKATITLSFEDGSIGTVHYLANGHKSFPKERLEVFCAGRILQLDNFRRLKGYGWPGFSKMDLWRQDKGQAACASAFVDAIRAGRPSPIAFEELVETARVTIEVAEALRP